jgi:hypothetical protein
MKSFNRMKKPGSANASGYAVQFVGAARHVPDILWELCFAPPLEGRWWYESLENAGLEDQFTFYYAVIWRDEEPVGLAPVFTMDVPIELVAPPEAMPVLKFIGKLRPASLYQRTLFVGSPCSDEGAVEFVHGVDRRAALSCLQEALDKKAKQIKAPMLVWKDLPSSFEADMAWVAAQHGLFPMISFPGSVVHLSSRKKEDYLANLKGSRRHTLKKKLKRSVDAVAVKTEVVQRPGPAAMDEIFALFLQTYEKATTKFERLNRQFFDAIAEQQVSHFVILREAASDQMIAFMLCFEVGGYVINKFIGLDYSRPKEWALYFRLWNATVDWALAQGYSSIQSGQTGYQPKIEVGHSLVPLTNYCRHRNFLIHRIYNHVAKTVSWRTLDEQLATFLKAHPEEAPSVEQAGRQRNASKPEVTSIPGVQSVSTRPTQ